MWIDPCVGSFCQPRQNPAGYPIIARLTITIHWGSLDEPRHRENTLGDMFVQSEKFIEAHVDRLGDTFHHDHRPGLKADHLLANALFTTTTGEGESLKDDKRRVYGVLPAGKVNFSRRRA